MFRFKILPKCISTLRVTSWLKTFTFTFMHLADAFIQSDLQYMQVIHVLSACVFPGKTQFIAAMEASKRTGSEITDYTRPKKHLHPSKMLYDHRHIKMQVNPPISLQCVRLVTFHRQLCLFLLRVLNLATREHPF